MTLTRAIDLNSDNFKAMPFFIQCENEKNDVQIL